MKIRTDFVTNSSSTSFVIITPEEFEKQNFFALMGLTTQSPLAPIFEMLFDSIKHRMEPAREYFRYPPASSQAWFNRLTKEFSKEVATRIIEAEEKGYQVFIGELSSDSNLIEGYFCTESFEVENDEMYFNALNSSW